MSTHMSTCMSERLSTRMPKHKVVAGSGGVHLSKLWNRISIERSIMHSAKYVHVDMCVDTCADMCADMCIDLLVLFYNCDDGFRAWDARRMSKHTGTRRASHSASHG